MGLIVKRVTNSVSPDFLLPSNVENERRASFLQTFYSNRVSVTRYFTSLSLSLPPFATFFFFLRRLEFVRFLHSFFSLDVKNFWKRKRSLIRVIGKKEKKRKEMKNGTIRKMSLSSGTDKSPTPRAQRVNTFAATRKCHVHSHPLSVNNV